MSNNAVVIIDGAGIPATAGAVTVNKACGSGMQAAIFAYDSIMAGNNSAVCGAVSLHCVSAVAKPPLSLSN